MKPIQQLRNNYNGPTLLLGFFPNGDALKSSSYFEAGVGDCRGLPGTAPCHFRTICPVVMENFDRHHLVLPQEQVGDLRRLSSDLSSDRLDAVDPEIRLYEFIAHLCQKN